jgi:hypothetical protein
MTNHAPALPGEDQVKSNNLLQYGTEAQAHPEKIFK